MNSSYESGAPIGRSQFDVETLSAMDEIAALLLAFQSLSRMATTFNNAPELVRENAKPHAKEVMEATKKTAIALQKAIFTRTSKRSQSLASVRSTFLPVIRNAAPSAQWLAERESAAVGGNVIEVRVLGAIRTIVLDWTSRLQ